MRIVVKFPTRSRGHKFLRILNQYIDSSDDPDNVFYLISIDQDDETMMNPSTFKAVSNAHENVEVVVGESMSKIHACNRDLNDYEGDWDIVVLASDDMIPQVQGWDKIIAEQMEENFPDTDGSLWFYDGHQHDICTMSIIGRKRYEKFKYLYHPDYISLWCDNEFTDVSKADSAIIFFSTCLFKHEHPIWMRQADKMDALYRKNEKYFKIDRRTYKQRKKQGFVR